MRTVHEAVIRAAPEAIFALAADVERWPALDRAYRWCRILERTPNGMIFEMAGRIRGWPARWTAIQERFPDEDRVAFRHIRGITRGMVVTWHLRASVHGTQVVITHDLVMPWPLIGRLVADRIVGPVFVDWIATRTLQGVKRVCEVDTWPSDGVSWSRASEP